MERQRWAATLVEDHLYVDAEGVAADSEVTRIPYVEDRGGGARAAGMGPQQNVGQDQDGQGGGQKGGPKEGSDRRGRR